MALRRIASAPDTLMQAVALAIALSCIEAAVAAPGAASVGDTRNPVTAAKPASAAGDDIDDSALLLASRGLIIPVAGVSRANLRDSFTDTRGAGRHDAIDITAPRGSPVVATGDGRVVKLFNSVLGGLTVYQFDPGEKFAYYYGHLDSYATGLSEGMMLKRGDLLGYVGTTGNAPPNAPHLHFAIFRLGAEKRWWQGTAVNPYPLLNENR